jgi:predicted transcriptional regulator
MKDFLSNFFKQKKDVNLEKDLKNLKKNIRNSFDNLKQDLSKQQNYINHLYSSHNNLNSLQENLKNHHSNHEKIHSKDIQNINGWITHLHDNQNEQQKAVKNLEQNVQKTLNSYNKYLLDIYKVVHDLKYEVEKIPELSNKIESYKIQNITPKSISHNYNNQNNFTDNGYNEHMNSENIIENLEDKSMKRKEQNIKTIINKDQIDNFNHSNNNREINQVNTKTISELSEKLTKSEKLIIAHLTNTNQKLSYKDLSMLMDVSTSTIKSHICNIKNKGFPLKETNEIGSIKRYYISENMKEILLSKTI